MLNDLLNDPNLHELIPLAVLFILALVVIGVLRSMLRLKKAGPVSAVYQRKAVLLSPAEAKFFEKLKSAVDDGYQVFGKVRLADIVEPRKDPGNSSQSGAYQRIASEHVDFVLVLSASMGIACVIELDDVSHRPEGCSCRTRRHYRGSPGGCRCSIDPFRSAAYIFDRRDQGQSGRRAVGHARAE